MTTNNRAVLDVLVQARELIAAPENWTQDAAARDVGGRACDPFSPGACCWCSLGALSRAYNHIFGDVDESARDAIEQLRRHLPPGLRSVSDFNDDPNTTHADVIALFDRAITSLRYELSDSH